MKLLVFGIIKMTEKIVILKNCQTTVNCVKFSTKGVNVIFFAITDLIGVS